MIRLYPSTAGHWTSFDPSAIPCLFWNIRRSKFLLRKTILARVKHSRVHVTTGIFQRIHSRVRNDRLRCTLRSTRCRHKLCFLSRGSLDGEDSLTWFRIDTILQEKLILSGIGMHVRVFAYIHVVQQRVTRKWWSVQSENENLSALGRTERRIKRRSEKIFKGIIANKNKRTREEGYIRNSSSCNFFKNFAKQFSHSSTFF